MENRAYTLGAGLFVLLLLAALIGAILWFNERGHLHGVPYDLISSASVAGLTVGANVSLRGVQIGQVQSIAFDPDDPANILVRIGIDSKVRLRKGSYATLNFQGLSGNAYVELDFPSAEHELLTSSLPTPTRIPLRLSSWATLPDTGQQFLTSFTGTLGRVNAILTPENAQQLSRLLVQFSAIAEQITGIARDLRPAARRVGRTVMHADEALRSAHKTLEDLDTLVADVHTHVGVLDAVGEGAHETGLAARDLERALVLDTLPRLNQLLQGLSQNSDSLQELLEQLKQQPQSVLFGPQPPSPGPGERGFSPPRTNP
jgi:phospholipid/cholesterol/gamma-HCH transport system substrate-binding protein